MKEQNKTITLLINIIYSFKGGRREFTLSLLKEEEDEFWVFESEPFYMHYELHLCFFSLIVL